MQSETKSMVFPITLESTIQFVVFTNCGIGRVAEVGSRFATSHGFTLVGEIGVKGVVVVKFAGL
jgi:hypothetical protein